MASDSSSSSSGNRLRSAFWERLNALFSRKRGNERERYDAPRNRGVIVSLCIVFAVLLWFFSSMATTYSRQIVLPTRLVNMPADEALLDLPPKEVRVEIEGEGLHLLRLYYNRPVIPVNAEVEVFDFSEAVNANLPGDIHLENVWPRMYGLKKELRAVRKVPVTLQAAVTLPPTHALLSPLAISPDSVVISGPESVIAQLTSWPTAPVRIEELKDSLSRRVPLVDSLAGIVNLGVRTVTLHAHAAEFTEATRSIDVFVAGVPSMSKAIQLDPPAVMVRFRVPLSQYQRAQQARDFLATVTYDDIRNDTTGYIEPRLELPHDIVLRDVEVSPSRVRYYDLLVDR